MVETSCPEIHLSDPTPQDRSCMVKNNNLTTAKTARNKILVACHKDQKEHLESFLTAVFPQPCGRQEVIGSQILKNVTWKTKYYSLLCDLYIDVYENLDQWLLELKDTDYAELREVLAGIIIIDTFEPNADRHDNLLTLLDPLEYSSCFKIWCSCQENINQHQIDEANNYFTEIQFDLEVVKLKATEAVNEFGEKTGISRLKEIVDTHEWLDCESIMTFENRPGVSASQDEGCNENSEDQPELEVELVLKKLREARWRFANQELSDVDAAEIADEVANEIVKNI